MILFGDKSSLTLDAHIQLLTFTKNRSTTQEYTSKDRLKTQMSLQEFFMFGEKRTPQFDMFKGN
jgi:hypothetical protein